MAFLEGKTIYIMFLMMSTTVAVLFILVTFGVIGTDGRYDRAESAQVMAMREKSNAAISDAGGHAYPRATSLNPAATNVIIPARGLAVSRFGGGTYAAVGEDGTARVYRRNNTEFEEVARIPASRPDARLSRERVSVSPHGRFACFVEVQEDQLAAGRAILWPSGHTFERPSRSVQSVVFDVEDDSSVYVTYYDHMNRGEVVLYTLYSNLGTGEKSWRASQMIAPADVAPFDMFGCNVYVDGHHMLVSSLLMVAYYWRPNRRAQWSFHSFLAQEWPIAPWFGCSSAVNHDGTVAFLTSPYDEVQGEANAGSVAVFMRKDEDSAWERHESKIVSPHGPTENGFFGYRVFFEDGHLVIVESAPEGENPQRVYQFDWQSWTVIQIVRPEKSGSGFDTSTAVWRERGGKIGMICGEQENGQEALSVYKS